MFVSVFVEDGRELAVERVGGVRAVASFVRGGGVAVVIEVRGGGVGGVVFIARERRSVRVVEYLVGLVYRGVGGALLVVCVGVVVGESV